MWRIDGKTQHTQLKQNINRLQNQHKELTESLASKTPDIIELKSDRNYNGVFNDMSSIIKCIINEHKIKQELNNKLIQLITK